MSRMFIFDSLTLVMIAASLQSCASFLQSSEEAVIREPGHRIYGPPVPVSEEAAKHWAFALLSEAAYASQQASAGKSNDASTCPEATLSLLDSARWIRWKNFPDDGLLKAISDSHLRVEVWEKKDPATVVVAFGGTVFSSGKDWRSNLRWFLPTHQDEYTAIVKDLGPSFVAEFERRKSQPENNFLRNAKLIATGHSLGGGLAQQFAYALPASPLVPRVSAVYAFDPSPVTGFYSVDADLRDKNAEGLSIDRVFERDEVLASIRSILSWFYPPSASAPEVRTVRYSLFYTLNPVGGHSMSKLACKLYEVSGDPPKRSTPQHVQTNKSDQIEASASK